MIAKDPKVITFKEDIKDDPAKTLNVACASTAKQNYKDAATGKIEKIDTTIIINQKGNFANKAADFYIEFEKDPNLGWTFSKGQEYLKVTSVSFGGKKLQVNTPVIKGNTLTFPEVLAGIDLEYTVSSEGVSKNIIVKTKEALDAGIESIEFTLQDNKNSTFTKKSEKANIKNKLAKNANTVQQIDKEVLDAEAKQTKDLEQKIKDKKISKEKADIEKKRISELPVANETISTSNDKYLLLTPETNIQTKDGYFTVKESFSLANNKLIIYPNIEGYKQNANIIYPIRIDPQTQAPTASKDTFTTSAYPTSARGSNNMKSLVVGGQAYIYTGSGLAWIGDSRTYLRFEMPGDLKYSSYIYQSYLSMWAYDIHYGGGTAYVNDYCGKDFDEWSMTWNTQGDPCGWVSPNRPTIAFYNISSGVLNQRNSTDLSEGIRAYGAPRGYMTFSLTDTLPQYTGDYTICSKDTWEAPCQGGNSGPRLTIVYEPLRNPYVPTNTTPNNSDFVASCDMRTGANCGVWVNATLTANNWHDGMRNCNASNLEQRTIYRSNFNNWNGALYTDVRNLTDFGGVCQDWNISIPFTKFNGTYLTIMEARTKDFGLWSGWSNQSVVTLDNSAPVRTGAITPLKPVMNAYNTTINIPEFKDNAITYLNIQNVASGGRIDVGGSGLWGNPQYPQAYVAPAYGNDYQRFVMESSGWIRSRIDGRCLGEWGVGNTIYTTSICEDANYQKWDYNPETREIKSRSWGYCLEQYGNELRHSACNGTQSQKWIVNQDWGIDWAENHPQKKIAYYVERATDINFTQNVVGLGWTNSLQIASAGMQNGFTYHFRVFVSDRSGVAGNYSNWVYLGNTRVDMEAPVIANIQQYNAQFSPNNATSVGAYDLSYFTYDYIDATPYASAAQIFDASGVYQRTLWFDANVQAPNQNALVGGSIRQYFNWDGKNDAGQYLPDGTYTVKLIGVDQTCNGIDWWSATCNRAESYIYINLDNSGTRITKSIANNSYTKNTVFNLTGTLVRGTDSPTQKDISKAYICVNSCSTDILNFTNYQEMVIGTVAATGDRNFAHNINLVEGANQVYIKTIDNVANKSNTMIDGNDVSISQLTINRDTVVPVLSSFTLKSKTPAASPNIGQDSIFTLIASDAASGLRADSVFVEFRNASTGVYIPYTITSNCVTGSCEVKVLNLIDNNYNVTVRVSDNVGNVSTKVFQYNQKMSTYLKLDNPVNGIVVANPTIKVSGVTELGNSVNILLANVSGNASFIANATANGTNLIKSTGFTNVTSPLTVTCSGTIDHDGNTISNPINICNWSFDLTLAVEGASTLTVNSKLVSNNAVYVQSQRSVSWKRDTMTLSIAAEFDAFSPNADGQFDTSRFFVIGKNADGSTVTTIDTYTLDIKNGSSILRTYTGTGTMPTILSWDGKNASGVVQPDGLYTAALTIKRTTSGYTTTTTASTTVILETVVGTNEKPVIVTPKNNAIQTRGTFIVAGQAPANTDVYICLSRVAQSLPQNCVTDINNDTYKIKTKANSVGGFYDVVEIADTSTKDYYITVIAGTATSIYTPVSSTNKITVDLVPGILSIDLLSNLEGINSQADIDALLAGTKTLNDLKTLKIKVRVSQGTEKIDINFNQYTNGLNLPTQFPSALTTLGSNCALVECTWEYEYAYPSGISGGNYELEFKVTKGGVTQTLTRGFNVNGELPSQLTMFRMMKGGSNGVAKEMKIGEYYTNQLSNELTLGAEINKSYSITVTLNSNILSEKSNYPPFGDGCPNIYIISVNDTETEGTIKNNGCGGELNWETQTYNITSRKLFDTNFGIEGMTYVRYIFEKAGQKYIIFAKAYDENTSLMSIRKLWSTARDNIIVFDVVKNVRFNSVVDGQSEIASIRIRSSEYGYLFSNIFGVNGEVYVSVRGNIYDQTSTQNILQTDPIGALSSNEVFEGKYYKGVYSFDAKSPDNSSVGVMSELTCGNWSDEDIEKCIEIYNAFMTTAKRLK